MKENENNLKKKLFNPLHSEKGIIIRKDHKIHV